MNNSNESATPAVAAAVAPAKKAAAPAKKSAKKSPAKKAAPKKTALKAVEKKVEVLKASSMAEAIKAINKAERRRGLINVGGKTYSYTRRATWAISKNLIAAAVAGLIMVVEDEGFYVYPKAKFTELFGSIFKSKTYKEIGIYSQSTLPQWHEDFFIAKK